MTAIPCVLRWRERYEAGSAEREQPVRLQPRMFPVVPLALAAEVSGLPAERISDARLRVVDTDFRKPESL